MLHYKKEFLIKLRKAYDALNDCKVDHGAGPEYKGLIENLWQIAQFPSERDFLRAIYPGSPANNTQAIYSIVHIVDVTIAEEGDVVGDLTTP